MGNNDHVGDKYKIVSCGKFQRKGFVMMKTFAFNLSCGNMKNVIEFTKKVIDKTACISE